MFRTLYVTGGQTITVSNNWLLITTAEDKIKVPLEDIQTIIIDNIHTMISAYTLQQLADKQVNTVICDSMHLPGCNIMPLANHYRPYGVLKKQLALTDEFKARLWQKIVKAKITNQRQALVNCGCVPAVANRMRILADEVLPADCGNREAIAAKMFFRNFYGCNFIRFGDDVVNAALNYGYAVIRSAVARSLCAYGYNCILGIHHISETNPFNLADDFMEPLRPLADLWVFANNEDLVDKLSKSNKIGLANILNTQIMLGNKNMQVYNAIDKYISSIGTAIDQQNLNKLLLPYINGK